MCVVLYKNNFTRIHTFYFYNNRHTYINTNTTFTIIHTNFIKINKILMTGPKCSPFASINQLDHLGHAHMHTVCLCLTWMDWSFSAISIYMLTNFIKIS
jgi:hypothetical protein